MYNPVYTIAAVGNYTTPSGVGPATHGVGMVVPGPGRGSANVVNVGRESQLNLEDPDATLPMEETEPGVDGTSVWSSGRKRLTVSSMAPKRGANVNSTAAGGVCVSQALPTESWMLSTGAAMERWDDDVGRSTDCEVVFSTRTRWPMTCSTARDSTLLVERNLSTTTTGAKLPRRVAITRRSGQDDPSGQDVSSEEDDMELPSSHLRRVVHGRQGGTGDATMTGGQPRGRGRSLLSALTPAGDRVGAVSRVGDERANDGEWEQVVTSSLGTGAYVAPPRSVVPLLSTQGAGENESFNIVSMIQNVSDVMKVLSREMKDMKEWRSQLSTAPSEPSRATSPEAAPRLKSVIIRPPSRGRSTGARDDPDDPTDDEWSTPAASPTRRNRSRSRSRGPDGFSRQQGKLSRSTVAARGPVDMPAHSRRSDGQRHRTESTGSEEQDAVQRRGRSSTGRRSEDPDKDVSTGELDGPGRQHGSSSQRGRSRQRRSSSRLAVAARGADGDAPSGSNGESGGRRRSRSPEAGHGYGLTTQHGGSSTRGRGSPARRLQSSTTDAANEDGSRSATGEDQQRRSSSWSTVPMEQDRDGEVSWNTRRTGHRRQSHSTEDGRGQTGDATEATTRGTRSGHHQSSSGRSRGHRRSRSSTSKRQAQDSPAGADDQPSTTRKRSGGTGGEDPSDGDGTSSESGAAGGRRPAKREEKETSRSRSGHRRTRRHSGRSRSRSSSRPNQKRNWIKPATFDGTTCVDTFLRKFEKVAAYNEWSVKDKFSHLYCSLVGPAEDLLYSSEAATYEELTERLRQRYGTREQQEKFRLELKFRRRKSVESLQELASQVEKLTKLAYPSTDAATRSILARDAFIDALDNRKLQREVRGKDPASLDSALTLAMKSEVLDRGPEREGETQRPKHFRAVAAATQEGGQVSRELATPVKSAAESAQKPGGQRPGRGEAPTKGGAQDPSAKVKQHTVPSSTVDELKQMYSSLARDLEGLRLHVSTALGQQQDRRRTTSPSAQRPAAAAGGVASATWEQSGVYVPQRRQPLLEPGEVPGQSQRRNTVICFQCGGVGHFKRDCPALANPPGGSSVNHGGQQGAASGVTTYRRQSDAQFMSGGIPGGLASAERVYLKAKIYGRTRLCLLDSGSEVTLIPTSFIGNRKVQWTRRKIWAANGTEIPVKGWISLNAYVGGQRVEISGLVTDHIADIFLGLDWLQLNAVDWNFGRGEIVLNGKRHRLLAKKMRTTWCRRVVAEADVVIPARSQFDLSTRAVYDRLPQRSQGEDGQVWATEPGEIKDGLFVAGTLLPDRSTHLPVRVLNSTEKPVVIRQGTKVSDVSTVTTGPVKVESTAVKQPTSEEVINEMVSKVDRSISEDIKERLRALLRRYSSVISLHELDLGWTDLVTHTINTGDARPIRQQLRRHPPAHQAEIDKQVSDLLAQKVIEPAASPWSSNVVLAKKADGTWRCCIDFRQLNDVTRKDAYPLPRTDQCFDALAGSCLFSSLDLRSGYHQCALSPADSDKTAFVTRRGMFKFRVLPFGLCNAVATFQRLMDIVLSGLNFEVCLVYIDDVILMSSTPEQHLKRLEMVLERFKKVNLKLKQVSPDANGDHFPGASDFEGRHRH